MRGNWEPDARVLSEVVGPSGDRYTIRRDLFAVMLAKEAESAFSRLPSSEPVVGFLRDELSASVEALRLGITAALSNEPLAGLILARFELETAIRLSWIMGEGQDPEKVRTRLRRLEKLELRQLIEASDAISEVSGLGALVQNRSELQRVVKSIAESPALRQLRTMAAEAGWEWLYGLHRYCSSVLHPGIGARGRLWESTEPKELTQILHYSFSGTVMAAVGIAAAILPRVDVSDLRLNATTFTHSGDAEAVLSLLGNAVLENEA